MASLTKAQKEALKHAPLFITKGDHYTSDTTDKEFKLITITILIRKGLLVASNGYLIKTNK